MKKIFDVGIKKFQDGKQVQLKDLFTYEEYNALMDVLVMPENQEEAMKQCYDLLRKTVHGLLSGKIEDLMQQYNNKKISLKEIIDVLQSKFRIFDNLGRLLKKFFHYFDRERRTSVEADRMTSEEIIADEFFNRFLKSDTKEFQTLILEMTLKNLFEEADYSFGSFLKNLNRYLDIQGEAGTQYAFDMIEDLLRGIEKEMLLRKENFPTDIFGLLEATYQLSETVSANVNKVIPTVTNFKDFNTRVLKNLDSIFIKTVEKDIIEKNPMLIKKYLDNEDNNSLRRLCNLFQKSKSKILYHMKEPLKAYMIENEERIVQECFPNKELLFDRMVEFLKRSNYKVNNLMANDVDVVKGKTEAIEHLMSIKKQVGDKLVTIATAMQDVIYNRTIILIKNYKIEKDIDISAVRNTFSPIAEIISFIPHKKFFENLNKFLSEKIINTSLNTGFAFEKELINVFKAKFNAIILEEAELIHQERERQKDTNNEYKTYKNKNNIKEDYEFSHFSVYKAYVDDKILFKVPAVFSEQMKALQDFFTTQKDNDKKVYEVNAQYGCIEAAFDINNKEYHLSGRPVSIFLLMLFIDNNKLTYKEIREQIVEQTTLQEDDVHTRIDEYLQQLLSKSLIIEKEGVYALNGDFNSDEKRIVIGVNQKNDQSQNSATLESVIVKIMKERKKLSCEELRQLIMTNKLISNTSDKEFSESINSLIKKQFLYRDSVDPNTLLIK